MANPITIVDAVIKIAGDLAGVDKAVDASERKAQTAGQRIAKAIAPENIGKMVGLAIGAVGIAAVKLGGDVDEAYDTIRIGTGATGEALRGLEGDFQAVAGSVVDDMGTVAGVIADINTRTGLTGEGLQTLAKQILDLSRITKTDAAGNVALATRLFGDWSVATEDQSAMLDGLFRVSQDTGIGIDELMGKVVQFGAPLRNIGFDLAESAALLGKWEKEGVNTELALGGMKIALGSFAKEGIDAKKGLADLVAQIIEFGPGAEAMALGAQRFGSRAGPDMVAAILEGRFAIDEYVETFRNGTDTIATATADTEDMGDAISKFVNGVKAKFGSLFTVFGGVAQAAGPLLITLPLIGQQLGGLAGKLGPRLIGAILGLIPGVAGPSAAVGAATAGGISLGAIALPALLLAAVVAAILFLVNNPEIAGKIGQFVGSMLEGIGNFLQALPGLLGDFFGRAFDAVIAGIPGFVESVVDFILDLPGRLADLHRMLVGFFGEIWSRILAGAPGFIAGLVGFLFTIPGHLAELGGRIVGAIIQGLSSLPGKLAAKIADAFRGLRIDVGPFHISGSGISIDLPRIDLPSFDIGTNFVPFDMLAAVHEGEIIVPAAEAADIREGRKTLGRQPAGQSTSRGGDTYHIAVQLPRGARPDPFETARQLRRLANFGVLTVKPAEAASGG